jgi:hypothetical protein
METSPSLMAGHGADAARGATALRCAERRRAMEGGSRTPDSKTFNTSCKDGCKQNRLVKHMVFAQVALDMMSLALHAVFKSGAQIRDAKTHPTRQKPEMQHVEIPGHLKQAKT